MIIVGCDDHPGLPQIAFVDTDTGELQERRLQHPEEAEPFYRDLAAHGIKGRVGMEAGGHARWLERLLAELNFELWIGDATEIARKRERKQKTDRQDAQHILKLLRKDDPVPRSSGSDDPATPAESWRRRFAQGASRNDSSCCRPCSRHSLFLQRSPSFNATACS